MSNDNRTNLKADHGQHRELQKEKRSNVFSIVYMLSMAFLVTSLLIPSCQQIKQQGVTNEHSTNKHP